MIKLTESMITRQIKMCQLRLGAEVIQKHGQIFNKIPSFAGLSDLLVCMDTKFIAIEVKRPGLKPTPLQLAFLARVRRAGGIAFVAYSVEDVMRELGLKAMLYLMFAEKRK